MGSQDANDPEINFVKVVGGQFFRLNEKASGNKRPVLGVDYKLRWDNQNIEGFVDRLDGQVKRTIKDSTALVATAG